MQAADWDCGGVDTCEARPENRFGSGTRMQTKIISTFQSNTYEPSLVEAGRALREGALVLFPTETVYGVAANAARPDALRRLRELKGSTASSRPFTVHLGRKSDAAKYLTRPSAVLRRLSRKCWPGPLTMVVQEASPEQTEIFRVCPQEQQREIYYEGRVGLRCPDHPAALVLLGRVEMPIVATSANASGQAPPTEFEAAYGNLDGKVDYALNAGRTRLGTASTVINIRDDHWSVQRAGPIEERTLRRLARSVILIVCTGNSCRSPMAEYMFRHKLAESLGVAPQDLAAAGYEVVSAGTAACAGCEASAGAVMEMARRGIDLGRHRSQPLTIELIQQAERIYVMTPEHRDLVLILAPGAASVVELLDPRGAVLDPLGGGPEDYVRTAEHLEHAVEARLKEFLDEDRNW
jgi:tRNA threonylcarbamoyl adenosine modification protein (Sua5/YciO/YrdC/YwlC family)